MEYCRGEVGEWTDELGVLSDDEWMGRKWRVEEGSTWTDK